jgi:hypothetical protein
MQTRWTETVVDRAGDHMELRFRAAPANWGDEGTLVAILGPPVDGTFPVEIVVDAADPGHREAVKAVRAELDFYLVEKGEESAWGYAQYHCTTAANVYSRVHWSFVGGTGGDRVPVP